jgi:hypothetical protein
MYRIVVRAAGTAAAGCAIFYAMALIGAAIDPGGITVPRQLSRILLTVTIVGAVVAIHGWQVQVGARRAADEAAERTAAAVSHAVAGSIEQLLYRVAEGTARTAHDELVAAIREVAAGVSADLSDALGGRVETWLGRAHTRGMIEEVGGRPNGNVAPIRREV